MTGKTRRFPNRKNNVNLKRKNLVTYATKPNANILPYLKQIVIEKNCKYYNTHNLDVDILKAYPEWANLKRAFRISVILAVLMEEFGFKLWSEDSRNKKIVYDPSREDFDGTKSQKQTTG